MRDDEIFETDLQEIVADLEEEVLGESDEAAIDTGEVDGEEELDELLAGEVRAAPRGCPPQAVNVDCPPPGARPTEVLDNFSFDRADLNASRHAPVIAGIARRIIASQRSRRPIRTILIAGHTDPAGPVDYNFQLGWRRARAVMNELCRVLERTRPGITRSLRFQLTSCGERQPKATAVQSRRAELFLLTPPGARRTIPPDHSTCGVPRNPRQAEIGLAYEVQQLQRTARAQTVRPRLSIFQNASNTSHRNHFQCQASRWGRRIGAIASPDAANCPRRVGPTPYDTGADLIRAIEAARACVGRAIEAVHVFSHSGSYGVFGTLSGGSVGLYTGALDADSRRQGGRLLTDIPTAPFSQNVVFVLHGCNAASGDDNFARALFNHLAASLRNPTVYGHPNSGCAGRDNSWREYSRRSPDGRRRPRSIAPHYQGDGCCTPATREIFETDLQELVADLEEEVFGETDEAAIEAELELEEEGYQWPQWPTSRSFKGPAPGGVSVGPPKTFAPCNAVLNERRRLQLAVGEVKARLAERPANPGRVAEAANVLTEMCRQMVSILKERWYTKQGCTKYDFHLFAQSASAMRGGGADRDIGSWPAAGARAVLEPRKQARESLRHLVNWLRRAEQNFPGI